MTILGKGSEIRTGRWQHLWVQLADKGIVVQAFADVALHMAPMLPRQVTQTLQEGGGAGRYKARCNHWVDQ